MQPTFCSKCIPGVVIMSVYLQLDQFCYSVLIYIFSPAISEVRVERSVGFSSNSRVEFDRSLLPQESGSTQKVTFEFTTLRPDGLFFWYGQEANVSGHSQDYVSVACQYIGAFLY